MNSYSCILFLIEGDRGTMTENEEETIVGARNLQAAVEGSDQDPATDIRVSYIEHSMLSLPSSIDYNYVMLRGKKSSIVKLTKFTPCPHYLLHILQNLLKNIDNFYNDQFIIPFSSIMLPHQSIQFE